MAKKDYYSMTKNRRIKDKEEKDITSPSSSEKKDYYGLVSKKRMENNINLDTLGSDIESANSSLQSVYEGWQEQNVLQNTKSSVSSIQDRVKLYKDYVNQYGGVDDVETFNAEIDKTYNSYKDVLDSLESLEQEYGRYKDSGSYSNAQKKAQMVKDFSGLSYDDVQAKLKEYDKDSDEYKFLSEYGVNVGYGDLRDYDKELESIGMSRDAVKEAQNTIAGSPLSKSFDGSSVPANEYGERLAENARKYALDHAFDSYKDIQNTEGFEESSKYKEAEYDGLMDRLFNEGKDAYEYVNFVHSQPSELVGMPSDKYGWNAGIGKMPAGIENMTKEEVAVFNAIADEKGYDEAFKFLKDMEVTLSKRGADKNSASTAEWLEDGNAVTRKLKQGAMTVLSVPTGLVGGVEGALDDVSNVFSGDEINPYNSSHSMMNFANTVQSTTSENIGEYTEENEWVGTDLPLVGNAWSFGYDTGLSIAESAIGISTFGSGFTPIMGMGAASNKAKELKEAGATENEVVIGATASGVAEAFFEKYSIEGLLGSETPDTIRKAAKNFVKQSLTEASEEMVTEFSNAIVDLVNRQNTSDIMKSYNDYLERGYSEEEAFNQVHRDVAEDIIVAGIGGAISGGVMGGTYNSVNYHNLDSQGKQIRANERAQDMMALSEMTPKESETYKLYNEYAQKGVNADNIKNAQLGNLYTTATSEGVKTSIATTPKTAEEKAREQRAMSLHTGEETKVADTGNSVKIKGIKTDGDETILLTSDGEVSANNIALSKSDAELVSFAESMGEEKGNLLLSQYDGTANVKAYVNSFEMAYSYGETGFGADSVLKNRGVLTEAQAAEIYKAGMMNKVNVQQKAIAEINAKHSKEMTVKGVLDDSIIDYDNATTDGSKVAWKSLTSTQREAITFAKGFAEATGVNIKFVKSDIVNGKHVGKNGSYNPESNTIEIDVYAGRIDVNSTKDAIIPTISHEVTHWMKAKSPAMYNQMREYVMNTLSNGKYTAEQLVGAEIDRIKKNHPDAEVSEDMAIDELIARACEDMLSNSNAARKMLNQLSTKDKSSFVEKVKKTFKNLMDWVNELLSKYKSGSNEAKFLREYQRKLKELSKMWDEALVEAVRTNQSLQKEGITGEQAINAVMEKVGITVDLGTESASPATQFSERTWTESEYVQNREKAVAQLSKALGVSKKKAGQYIDDINSIARLIADDRARLDYDPNLDEHATVVKPNSEYKYSVDMSTLCAKRLLFTGTFDAIQRMLPNTAMDSDDIVKIRAMMKDAGHEVACGICYVESTRREIGTITADFIERYKEAQRTGKPISRINSAGKEVALKEKGTGENFYVEEGYTPNLAELNTTDIDLVKRDHPSVYAAYLAYMNARGQAKPKLLETRAEYKGEILKHFKAKSAVQSRNAAGGLRLQSFSDFEIPHLIDMMQIITDMSSVGLMSQAYTKVPNFAEAFGDTGVKINLSLIAKDSGLDAEGNLIFDDVEGINHEDAFRLRDKYSKNVGTILVGKNDAHIIAAMADPRIDYIIPFHKSSWKESLYDALGLTGYDDYTETQNEKPIDRSRKISNFAPSEYWDYSKSGEENAQLYLEKCKADGRIPKFPQFQSYEGYWKLLIDFKMYDNDGVGSPQMPVTPNFNMDESRRMLEEYKGGHRSFPVAKDVVDKFVAEYKENHQQEQYSDRDSNYIDAVNRGDMETAQKMVDEKALSLGARIFPNGKLINYYHGTNAKFTSFDYEKAREGVHGFGFYFSPMKSKAEEYKTERGRLISAYLFTDNLATIDKHNLKANDVEKILNDFNVPIEEQEWLWHGYDSIEKWLKEESDRVAIKEIESRIYRNSDASVTDILREIRNTLGYDGIQANNETILFDNTLIKLADAVTYDDSGNVIPLSKRFDSDNADIRYSDREVRTLTDENYEQLKSHFGTTTNFNVAGYMLKDGKMLDFSGKHWGNPVADTRDVDHRDVWDAWENPDFDGTDEMVNMIANGNIRLMPETGGINLAVAPTADQRKMLEKYINHFRGEIVVDIDRVGGDTEETFTYDRGTSAKKIFDDIDNYFRGGRQSDLMRFHTMYSDREAFVKDIDSWNREGRADGETFVLGSTGDVLQGLGAIESDIYMKSDKINTILADHKEITLEEIKKIPSILEKPIMILASKNLGRSSKANSRIILFGSVKAKDGRPMLSVLDLRPVEKHLVIDDMQKVASVYTKDSNPVEFVRSSNVMYMDNKKTTSLLRTIGFQTPIELNESGFIGSISYRQQNVKLDGKPFSAVVNENTVQFSDRDNVSVYEAVGEDGRLASENAKLREDIAKLKSAISNEEISIRRFRSLADYLKKLAGSQYNRETLGDELKEIYTFIQTADNLQWNDVMAKVYDVANRMMNIKEGVTPNYFKRVLQDIRIDRVSLSAAQKGEVVNRFGNYSDFHKMMFGRINVVNEGTPLNEMWKTWSQKYPSIFDANLSETEQIKALVDIVDALKTTSSVMGEYEREEAIRHIATEVYNQFWNIASDSSEEVKKLRASHRSLMEELRTAYAERQKQNTLHPTGETALKYEQLLRKVKEKDAKEMARIKELSKARMDNYKDRLARNTKIQSITKKALTLNQWLVKNSKDEHVPEVMKEPVAYLLSAIDFSSKQLLGMRGGDKAYSPTKKDISLSKALEKVHAMVQRINSVQIGEDEITEIYGSFADFPMGFADDVSTLSGTVNDIMRRVGDNAYTLNEMSLEQLEELDNIVSIIKATVSKMNKFLAIRHAEGVAHLSQQSIDYMDSLGKGKVYDKILGKVDKTLQWGNALPYYTFKRFGEGGKMVYEAMQDGWDKFAFHVKGIIDYAENTYTSKEVKEWEEDIKEIDVLEPATDEEKSKRGYTPKYQTIQMSVPQIMSLYCLQKREQAKGHLLGGGIRVTDITTKKGVISQTEGAILSESEIDDIISRLTPRQREVADALQKFMNTTCAEWGNEVSMLRFGIKQFGEENYFPIQSDKNNLAVNDETEQNNSLFRLLNMSFTKGLTDKANNRVVISDIFDVFAQHASDMAKYNAMALPVLDAFKWYNYKEKVQKGETQFKTKSLKQSLENAFGKDGQNYFVTFLRDINGEKNVGRDTLSNGFFTNAKVASVGFNLKVVALQPTSYLRANAVIDTKYLTQALAHKPKVDMAEKYCGIALWKSLGFYDINVQRGVAELIKHEETLKDKAVEASMKGAEIADKITWGYLWNACEAEIRDTRKDLKVGSEEYYSVVGKRLREIIYTTQVVDSTMTRSQMMRSSDGGDKMLTAFASEPTLAYNMLQDCYYDWKLTERQTGSKSAAFRKTGRKMVRVYAAYTSTNLVASLIETIFQAYRDDDDEKEFLDHVLVFLENFGSNMGIATKIPYVKDLISIVQGFTSNRTDTQWVQNLVYAGKGWMKILNGEGNAYKTMYRTLQAISQVGGVPGSNLLREVVSLWNNTIGEIYPSLKIK